MSQDGRQPSAYGLENQGFRNLKAVHWNLTAPALYEQAVARGEGHVAKNGPLVVLTGQHTGRSGEIAELIELARATGLLLAPFHNRRWDSDLLTIKKLLHEGSLGRLVEMESRFDRWRPTPPTDRLWKDEPEGGGTLLDLGTHLCDQALHLFGKPDRVGAEVLVERDGVRANDSVTVRLRYRGLVVTLGSNNLALPPGARFLLRGTKGNYVKHGLDPQEAALHKVARIDGRRPIGAGWVEEPAAAWGTLHVGIDGGEVSRPVEPVAGDYRLYYAGIRDALLGKAAPPVAAVDAWRVARLLEWAAESSELRREMVCDWSGEPR